MDAVLHELKELLGPVGALVALALLILVGWVIKALIDRHLSAPRPAHPVAKPVSPPNPPVPPGQQCSLDGLHLHSPAPLSNPAPPPQPKPTTRPSPPPVRDSALDLELGSLDVQNSAPSFENSLGMGFAKVVPGTFRMGSTPTELCRKADEEAHVVVISKPFWIGIHPVTQKQFMTVMNRNPSAAKHNGENRPVESVSWDEATEFCRRLADCPAERAGGRKYRLPTEAEWEYACRAGTQTAYAFGDQLSPQQANLGGTKYNTRRSPGVYRGRITDIGEYPGNAWGVFDMHGNVWEWCEDFYAPDYGIGSPNKEAQTDPKGPASGKERVIKGGCWSSSEATDCRSARRGKLGQRLAKDTIGFRVVCDRVQAEVQETLFLGSNNGPA